MEVPRITINLLMFRFVFSLCNLWKQNLYEKLSTGSVCSRLVQVVQFNAVSFFFGNKKQEINNIV